MKVLSLRRAGTCADCAATLVVGARAAWDAGSGTVHCLACAGALPPAAPAAQPCETVVPRGVAGGSARREYERRAQRREQRIRSAHPKLAGLILALADEPASTRVWAQGARGERAVAATLDLLAEDGIEALHDRALRRPDGRLSRANIDHIAVSPAGAWVIDAKTHHGDLEVRRSGGLFSPRVEKLYINHRDRTPLIDGLRRQVTAVASELARVSADVPVRGVLCFVGTELPWFGASIAGVPLVGRRGLANILRRPGDLDADDRAAIAQFLGLRFPPAR